MKGSTSIAIGVTLLIASMLSIYGCSQPLQDLSPSPDSPAASQIQSDSYNTTSDNLTIQDAGRSDTTTNATMETTTPAEIPDLIIESVSYTPMKGQTIDFHVKVRNIGDGGFNGGVMVGMSRDNNDYMGGYYSTGGSVVPAAGTLSAGQTIEVDCLINIPTHFDGNHSDNWSVRFIVNHLHSDKDKSIQVPVEDESNYENNTYDMNLIISDVLSALNDSETRHPTGNTGLEAVHTGNYPTPLRPTLAWASRPYTTKYKLVVAEDAPMSRIVYITTTNTTRVTLPYSLMPNTRYFWSIQTVEPTTSSVTINTFITRGSP